MLTIDEALEKILERARPRRPARVALAEASGCVLAEDVVADLDLPPFDKALVDGYAVRSADLTNGEPRRLRLGETIVAGGTPTRPLAPGEAAAIMTGAPLPDGADAVVMLEQARCPAPAIVEFAATAQPGLNRLARGRELRRGEVVLKSGDRLNAAAIGLLAAVGRGDVAAIPRPSVAFLATGDELVPHGQRPGPGQIRETNTVALRALAEACGFDTSPSPPDRIARDEPTALRRAICRALEASSRTGRADVLVISGGVSAGTKDLVPAALESLGIEPVFHKVRLRPGKPLWFGLRPSIKDRPPTLVFGLPGNPVSGLVCFLLFVRPALEALAGRPARSTGLRSYPLAHRFEHRGERPTYHPARLVLDEGEARVAPLDWAGSADLRTVATADGFACFPAGDRDFEAGTPVAFLPWEDRP